MPAEGARSDGPLQPVYRALLRAPLRDPRPPGWLAASSPVELLHGAAADAVFMDALGAASPSLARLVRLSKDRGRPAAKPDAQLRKAALSVARYESRIRTRCTPFGLFAGVAPARAGEAAKVRWQSGPVSRTQVDLDWLAGLVREWESDPEIFVHLALHRHAGLVTRGQRLVVLAPSNSTPGAGDRPKDEISVRHTAAVRAALDSVRDGVAVGDVVRDLGRRFPGAPPGAALRVVRQLVDQEFLFTELRPRLDGSDALEQVTSVLERIAKDCAAARMPLEALRRVAAARTRYDSTPLGQRYQPLRDLNARMRELREIERSLHVDLALGAEVHLPVSVFDEAARAAGVLWRLSSPVPGAAQLGAYHEAFLERYGQDRLVPLPELLDDTRGLGAPAGYKWPQHAARPATATMGRPSSGTEPGRLLGRLVADACRAGRREVVLDDALVDRLAQNPPGAHQVPDSCEFYCQLVAASEEALSGGDYLLVAGPWPGPLEAGASMGRFAGLLGTLPDEVAAACARDSAPGQDSELPLTIAYQPRLSRARNVANCPPTALLRISLGTPSATGTQEVGLHEIAVGADRDALYAVHLPSGRRVRPRADHALDAQGQAPNAARLLLDIGRFGHHYPRPWEWGSLSDLPVLPRVRYGRAVLAAARWRLDELGERIRDQQAHASKRGDKAEDAWREAVAAWRDRWAVPRHVVVGQFDRRLRLDLECRWHLDVLRDLVAKQPDLIAEELPGGSERPDGWLRDGSDAPHLAELVVPLLRTARNAEVAPTPLSARTVEIANRARQSLPGEEWLYGKLYLPARSVDSFLRERLSPFLHGLTDDERAATDRWFFIRYRDDDDHLRLRFHGTPDALWQCLFPRLREAVRRWTDEGVIGRFALDTYDPEWERYGGPQVQESAERYFCADSRAALILLSAAHTGGLDLDSTGLAALTVASLAQGLAQPPPMDDVVRRYEGQDELGAAWLCRLASARELPEDFRERRAAWLRIIDPAGDWPGLRQSEQGLAVVTALKESTAALRAYVDQLSAHAGPGTPPLAHVVPSLTHMACNRLMGYARDRERHAHALARACVVAHADRRRHQR